MGKNVINLNHNQADTFSPMVQAALEKLLDFVGPAYSAGIVFVHRSRDRALDIVMANTDLRNVAVALNAKLVSNGIAPPGVPADHVLAKPDGDEITKLRAELALAKADVAHMASAIRKASPYLKVGSWAQRTLGEALTHAGKTEVCVQKVELAVVLDMLETADMPTLCDTSDEIDRVYDAIRSLSACIKPEPDTLQ